MQEIKIDKLGTARYYCNGQLHREDGPAIEYTNGSNSWYFHGLLHREDGPAVINADGTMIWYYNYSMVDVSSNEEFLRLMKLKPFW